MHGRLKIVVERFVYILIIGLLILSGFPLYSFLKSDASFGAWLEPVSAEQSVVPDRTLPPVPEPSEAYYRVTATFGGMCTPASMLGSDAYGTYNAALAKNGAEYSFSRLADAMMHDDYTFVGCSAVFSDRDDLSPIERQKPEWYRAPAKAAEIFPAGGVESVLLLGERLWDYGADGMEDTKNALTAAGVKWGCDGKAVFADLNEGIRAAVFCCELPDGEEGEASAVAAQDAVDWIESQLSERDFIVIYVSGGEDSYAVSPARETLFRSFIDAGANLVVGVGGSKMQRAEAYHGGMIAYSLGMLLDGTARYPEKYAALLEVRFKINDGAILDTEWNWIPVCTYTESRSWCPTPITDETEREAVLAFLRGETATPGG